MSISEPQTIPAVYHNGQFALFEPLLLPEGSYVELTVHLATPSPPTTLRRTARATSADRLATLMGLMAVGGDALTDSEALYDVDRD